jgi:hypothetical protein
MKEQKPVFVPVVFPHCFWKDLSYQPPPIVRNTDLGKMKNAVVIFF